MKSRKNISAAFAALAIIAILMFFTGFAKAQTGSSNNSSNSGTNSGLYGTDQTGNANGSTNGTSNGSNSSGSTGNSTGNSNNNTGGSAGNNSDNNGNTTPNGTNDVGVPNTGVGGDSATTWSLLALSALCAAVGALYLSRTRTI